MHKEEYINFLNTKGFKNFQNTDRYDIENDDKNKIMVYLFDDWMEVIYYNSKSDLYVRIREITDLYKLDLFLIIFNN